MTLSGSRFILQESRCCMQSGNASRVLSSERSLQDETQQESQAEGEQAADDARHGRAEPGWSAFFLRLLASASEGVVRQKGGLLLERGQEAVDAVLARAVRPCR